jgi:hypothetical protein
MARYLDSVEERSLQFISSSAESNRWTLRFKCAIKKTALCSESEEGSRPVLPIRIWPIWDFFRCDQWNFCSQSIGNQTSKQMGTSHREMNLKSLWLKYGFLIAI